MGFMDVLDQYDDSDKIQEQVFGPHEEEAIISLILDNPEFAIPAQPYLDIGLFKRDATKFVLAGLINYYEDYQLFPTRRLFRDRMAKILSVDDALASEVLAIIDRPSDPREVPAIKDSLLKWTKKQVYGMIWNNDTIQRYNSGDYAYIDDIVEKARLVTDVGMGGLWLFDDLERIFDEDTAEEFTCSIDLIDNNMHDGGQHRKEMFVWMAPTGVGKSIALANSAIANSKRGKKVLWITLELSDTISGLRSLGIMTDKPINNKIKRKDNKESMIKIAKALKANGAGDIVIHHLPPDEISVDQIYAIFDRYRRSKGWVADVIIVDYLELLISKRGSDNKDPYLRQKSVATQVRGLAQITNTIIYTATQTNRGGNDAETIDVTNIAESYGKAMPMDYLVSINLSQDELKEGKDKGITTGRLYIAKNRNGPPHITVDVRINYRTMAIKQVQV